MKKIIRILIFIIIVASMTGCSKTQETKKTEEELKAEIRAELEAEKEEEKAKEKQEVEKKKEALDVRNNDAIYEFIENTYPGVYTREDFDEWDAFYLDITGDGNDDVAFTATYREGNLDHAIFITADKGEYKIIPSEIGFAKYQNDVGLKDGFITITQKSGGSGIHVVTMGIYVYDGNEIVFTGANVLMKDVFAAPDGHEILGEIEGSLNDFVNTLKKMDFATEKVSLEKKIRYIYDSNTRSFNIEELADSKQKSSNDKKVDSSNQIELSVKMTKEEIINKLGKEYKVEKNIDPMGEYNYIRIVYPDITFDFLLLHGQDEAPLDALPSTIVISSDKYRYNYDVNIGDNALEAIEKCEKTFENLINIHGINGDEESLDLFKYKEDDGSGQMVNTGYVLTFRYNTKERYSNKEDIGSDVKVEHITLTREID